MDSQACCSHSRITRITESYPPGFTTEYWKCETCETRFCPEPLMQGRVLRDWFAGQIASGDAASEGGFTSNLDVLPDYAARRAAVYYSVADAMIAQREKQL